MRMLSGSRATTSAVSFSVGQGSSPSQPAAAAISSSGP